VRALLGLLALEPGQVLPAERLTDGLWGEDPPANIGNALATLAKRLRAATGSAESLSTRLRSSPRSWAMSGIWGSGSGCGKVLRTKPMSSVTMTRDGRPPSWSIAIVVDLPAPLRPGSATV
jgi:Transcriptional regulatory protein, C terminal